MNKPIFSIIIPVFNVEKYLSECLDSIFQQEFTLYEVICINDGSTDKSYNILIDYQHKFPQLKIFSQENQGQSVARNHGVQESIGEYILFIDGDDWADKNILSILYKYILENQYDIICFNAYQYYENTGRIEEFEGSERIYNSGIKYLTENKSGSQGAFFGCVWCRCYTKAFLVRNNISFDIGVPPHEDELYTIMVCYYATNIRTIPEPLYHYRIRQGSDMRNDDKKHQRLLSLILIGNTLGDFFIPKNFEGKEFIYEYASSLYIIPFQLLKEWKMKQLKKKLLSKINYNNFRQMYYTPIHRFHYFLFRADPDLYFSYKKFASRVFKIIRSK